MLVLCSCTELHDNQPYISKANANWPDTIQTPSSARNNLIIP